MRHPVFHMASADAATPQPSASGRHKRTAAQRRQQYARAHARSVQNLLRSFAALQHRGNQVSQLGQALQAALQVSVPHNTTTRNPGSHSSTICRHFTRGACMWGDQCRFSHSVSQTAAETQDTAMGFASQRVAFSPGVFVPTQTESSGVDAQGGVNPSACCKSSGLSAHAGVFMPASMRPSEGKVSDTAGVADVPLSRAAAAAPQIEIELPSVLPSVGLIAPAVPTVEPLIVDPVLQSAGFSRSSDPVSSGITSDAVVGVPSPSMDCSAAPPADSSAGLDQHDSLAVTVAFVTKKTRKEISPFVISRNDIFQDLFHPMCALHDLNTLFSISMYFELDGELCDIDPEVTPRSLDLKDGQTICLSYTDLEGRIVNTSSETLLTESVTQSLREAGKLH